MSDAAARRLAVDPTQSVIVQAPAGSGKTTLLVERYLGLLGVVDAPEEILAVTFTRKAAAEMRQRVLRYLHPDFHSDAEHEQAPLAKARAIADKVEHWQLLKNPQRLMIRTIDSFNHFLARSMPIASALGPVPAPADNGQALYRQAARNVLNLVEGDDSLAADLECLLDWRDHRSQDIENLLADLLGRREQWLRALEITGRPQRTLLEATLEELVCSQLEVAHGSLRTALQASGTDPQTLVELLRFAAATLAAEGRESVICQYADAVDLPAAQPDDLPLWQGLAEALLTRNNKVQFRKRIDKSIGFPPQAEEKQHFKELLDGLAQHTTFAHALHAARNLPTPHYSDDEWHVLDALVRVLVRAAAELELVFARSGRTDYAGLAAAALRGLGDEERGYTDLGLYLDRRIRHLLVDEYQDTNRSQEHLLEKLTSGWTPGDGRSLFLVGDPMQSIYRFREAEVGLFIRSRDQGIGGLPLVSVRLTSNFRSRSEIVAWVNDRLGPIFPRIEDIAAGAVAYAPSNAGRDSGGSVELLTYAQEFDEAEHIAQLLEAELSAHGSDAGYKAAIIVRARSHLREILPALARHGIPYRAVKLDALHSRPVVQDLLAITKAMVHPTDTTAVLAMLRAPLCGLTLEDLHALAGDGRSLFDAEALARLSEPARARAERVFNAMELAAQQWQRRPVRDLVEGTWHRLGGPQTCAGGATDLQDAGLYLDVLEQAESSGLLRDWNDFLELLDSEQAEGDPADDNIKLEILTMHGAKGLEWDLVVLPALHRQPGGSGATLLHWLPFTSARQTEQMLLAPLRAADQPTNSPLVELIRVEQRRRDAYEHQRLLYVATTRARQRLVLSACLAVEEDKEAHEIKPPAGSLLADLWPTCNEDFISALGSRGDSMQLSASHQPNPVRDQSLRRIAAGWSPSIGTRLQWQPRLMPREQDLEVEYNWAGMQARRTGTVLHRLLEQVGIIGIENLSGQQRERLGAKIPQLLTAMGARPDELAQQSKDIRAALTATLDSEIGQWILSGHHQQAACELAVAGVLDGRLVNAVIDRTFVDADGTRWIIDYKSGYHAGADLEGFLAEERDRYAEQLHRYRRLFEQLQEFPVKTALYLPRHSRLQMVGE
jgi:ATP-dependent exoDNAse (exonuclease V) beta subunit